MALTTAQIRQFGVRFQEACIKFASEDLHAELSAAQSSLEPPPIDTEKPVTSLIQSVSFLFLAPSQQKAKAEQEARALDLMRDHLRYWMEVGELVGYGSQVAPTQVRVPRKIPADFWVNAQIDREQEVARDAARTYQRLLVIDPMDFPSEVFQPAFGPKYFGKQIFAVMEKLNSEIPNFRTAELSHKQRASLIRNRLSAECPSLNLR
ncbi:MAG: hypothetical protein EOP06_03610, partial [Proteobacteria bacterium]